MFLILFSITVIFWAYKVYYSLFLSPLKHVPGPLLLQLFPGLFFVWRVIGIMPFKVTEYHEKYGRIIRIGWNMVLFSDGEDVKHIYLSYKYPKNELYAVFDPLGATIFSARGKEFHLNRKRIMSPAFSQKELSKMETTIAEIIQNQLLPKLTDNTEIDLLVYFHLFVFDVIGHLVFNTNFNMINNGYHPIVHKITENHKRLMTAGLLPKPLRKYYDTKSDELLEFANDIINQAIEFKVFEDSNSWLSTMLKYKDDENNNLSHKDVVSEALTMIMAGVDSTSNTLIWIFYLLLKHPSIYKKLYNEIQNNKTEQVNYTSIKQNHPYLGAVIYEAMRLLPAAGGIPERVVVTPSVINNIHLPIGTNIGTCIHSLHNLSWKWEDATSFKPERWIHDGQFNKDKVDFLPFLIGPRACIGKNLAMMELYLTVYHIMANFEVELKDKDLKLTPKFVVLMTPAENKLKVNIKPRD